MTSQIYVHLYYASTIIVNAFKKQVFLNQNYIDTKSIILGYFLLTKTVYKMYGVFFASAYIVISYSFIQEMNEYSFFHITHSHIHTHTHTCTQVYNHRNHYLYPFLLMRKKIFAVDSQYFYYYYNV